MKQFSVRVTLFIIPIVLLAIPPYILLKGTGENYSEIESVIEENKSFLMGYAYNEDNISYLKWKTVETNKFPVVALGSSRVLQLRSNMFNVPFYNAGYTISHISDFKIFLQSIPKENFPEFLIIGLDQWVFNEPWGNIIHNKRYWSNSFVSIPKFKTLVKVYKDLFRGKYDFSVIKKESSVNKIGLNAIVNNKGFRNDGSIYYGTQIEKLINHDKTCNDYLFGETFESIESGKKQRFAHGDSINSATLKELEDVLSFCKQNGIYVVAFCPPYSNSVYDKMLASNKYNYLKELPSQIDTIFKAFDFEFYYYPTANSCNSNDDQFIDGFHGGEVTYCNILIDILKHNSKLNSVSNPEKVTNDLQNKKNRFIVYE